MSNLGTVIRFEVLRTIRKKSFWFTTIALPLFVVVIYAVDYASGQHASQTSLQQASSYSKTATVAIDDETGLISKKLLAQQHITTVSSKQAGVTAVQNNQITAFFYYPKNVASSGIQVYAQTQGISFTPPYTAAALALLKSSAIAQVNSVLHSPVVAQVLQKDPDLIATTYQNGKQTNGLAGIVIPGVFWILFMTLTALLSSYTISATTEEKENRAAEILLTTIKPRSFIVGKILSVLTVGLIQMSTIVLSLLVAYFWFQKHITLPSGLSLANLPIDPVAITFGVVFLLLGLVLYAGILVGFSALFPTAQEASRYLIVAIIWVFIPLYAIGYVIATPNSLIVSAFTYFPLTAPTTVLLRNAVGTLSVGDALISMSVLVVTTVVIMFLAIRSFRYGAMAYGRRISITEILR